MRIDGDDTAVGRGVGSLKIEFVALRADESVECIPLHEQRLRLRAGLAQVLDERGIRLVSVEQRDDEISSVLGDLPRGHVGRMIGDLVHQPIRRLRFIQLVEVHVRTTRIVAALGLFGFLPRLDDERP